MFQPSTGVRAMIVLGIDPGLSNGLAILDERADLLLATEIEPIGEGASKRLPLAGLVDLIRICGVTHGIIEDVGSMPGQGIASAFRFGRAAGAFEGLLSGLKIPTAFVRPAIWKRALGVNSSKEGCRALAIQRWPNQQDLFRLRRHHDRAEAAMLAVYFIEHQARLAA
jgi:crossover junction endodeoxyribonuclease RuvC